MSTDLTAALHSRGYTSTAAAGDTSEVITITEEQLADYLLNDAVTDLTIRQTAEGYVVFVMLTFRIDMEPVLVYRHRTKQPWAWASLDRLVARLTQMEKAPRTIKLEVERRVPTIRSLNLGVDRRGPGARKRRQDS